MKKRTVLLSCTAICLCMVLAFGILNDQEVMGRIVYSYSHVLTLFGIGYQCGYIVPQSYSEAMKWYVKAANLGNDKAMVAIGYMYGQGMGVNIDHREAMKWFKKALALGNYLGSSIAANNIGFMYEHGKGVVQDYRIAMVWYMYSADLGESLAMVNIGNMYYHGYGVDKDYSRAIFWYRKAVENGENAENIKKKLTELEEKLSLTNSKELP